MLEKKWLIIIFSYFWIGFVYAGNIKSPYQTIDKITIGSTGNLYVYTSGSRINPAGCKNAAYAIKSDHPVYKSYYTALLAAQMAGTKVRFAIDTEKCLIGYPVFVYITTD